MTQNGSLRGSKYDQASRNSQSIQNKSRFVKKIETGKRSVAQSNREIGFRSNKNSHQKSIDHRRALSKVSSTSATPNPNQNFNHKSKNQQNLQGKLNQPVSEA